MAIYDPKAAANAQRDLEGAAGVEFCSTPYEACRNAHAVVVLTDWNEICHLDFKRIFPEMQAPAFVFDGRNCLDHKALYELGFNVYPIGKPARTHF